MTFGLSLRYTCEKYFSTICSVAAEVNYAQLGWKEKMLTPKDVPVCITGTNTPLAYQRNINYIHVVARQKASMVSLILVRSLALT